MAGVVLFAGGLYWASQDPGAWWQLEALYSNSLDELSVASSGDSEPRDVLYLSQNDAEYLNRVYGELNTDLGDGVGEQGYCIDLVGGRMSVQQAGTIKSDEGSVTFRLSNCYGQVDGTIHFHPPDSVPELSETDEKTLVNSYYEYSCVQASVMSTDIGHRTRALKCYRQPASGGLGSEFSEVAVEIVD